MTPKSEDATAKPIVKSTRKTTRIDMPLIDILKPNKTDKKTKKTKKTATTASAAATAETTTATTLALSDSQQEKIAAKTVEHGDLFKGLDPASITKTDKYPSVVVEQPQQAVKNVDLPTIIHTVAQTKTEDKSATESQTTKNLAIETCVDGRITFSKSQLVKVLSDAEKKLLKSKRKACISQLKHQASFKFDTANKLDKAREKLIDKALERSLDVVIKQKKPKDVTKTLTYLELRQKLNKMVNITNKPSPKLLDAAEADKCIEQLRLEIEGLTLFEALKATGKELKKVRIWTKIFFIYLESVKHLSF